MTERFEFPLWNFAPDEWVGEDDTPPKQFHVERAEVVGEPGDEVVVLEIGRSTPPGENDD